MADYTSVFVYFGLVALITITVALASAIIPSIRSKSGAKHLPYESGILTVTRLFQERFTLHHYLVALIFLVLDIEVIFLYPWAIVGKSIGSFAFYEMIFFIVALAVGFIYLWRKGGLQWE